MAYDSDPSRGQPLLPRIRRRADGGNRGSSPGDVLCHRGAPPALRGGGRRVRGRQPVPLLPEGEAGGGGSSGRLRGEGGPQAAAAAQVPPLGGGEGPQL